MSHSDQSTGPSPERSPARAGGTSLTEAVSHNVRTWLHTLSNTVEQWSYPAGPRSNELWLLGKRYPRPADGPPAPEPVSDAVATLADPQCHPETTDPPVTARPATPPPTSTVSAFTQSAYGFISSFQTPRLPTVARPYPSDFLADFRSRIWCTYRSGFPTLPNSSLTSDAGWGCMLRAAQSLVAQAYVLHLLGRDWTLDASTPEMEQTYRQILKLVADYPGDEYALSVHRMGQRGQDLDVAVGQWFGPHLACHVIRDLINESRPFDLRVFLATDGVVYQDKLFTECRATAEDGNDNDDGEMLGPTLILVSTRLGIHQVNPVYYPFVKYCFSLPHFVGIAGGKPASAAYFVGFEDNDLIFLDPHYTRPAAGLDPADGLPHSADLPSYHCVAPNKVALSRVDPCMLLGFYVRNTAEFADLKVRLAELAHQQKDAPIVTIAERTPAYLTSEGFSDHEEEAEDSGSESGMGSRGIISKVNGEGTATITTDSVMTARVPAADAEADESAYEYISHWSVASTRPSLHRQPVSPTSSPPSLVRYPTGSRSAPSGDDDLVDITEAQATEPPVPIDMANLEDDAEVHNHGVVSQSESESEASPSNTLAAPAAVADDTAGFLLVNRTPRNQRKAVPDCRYRVQK